MKECFMSDCIYKAKSTILHYKINKLRMVKPSMTKRFSFPVLALQLTLKIKQSAISLYPAHHNQLTINIFTD